MFLKNRVIFFRILISGVSIAYPFYVYFYAQNTSILPLLYPVVSNFAVASIFAASLIYPPTVIERIARLSEPDLDDDGVQYTRCVTKIWVGFSLINGLISLLTVLLGNNQLWMLYNGCISYILMGGLLIGEYGVRQVHKRKKKRQDY